MENIKKLYRVEPRYRGYDDDSSWVFCQLSMYDYDIISETAKGVWIRYSYNDKKWISNSAKKRYAYPTPKKALEAFKHRNKAYIRILKGQLDRAEMAKNQIDTFEKTL